MGRRLILDTNVLIAYERGAIDRDSLDDDELAIAALSVAEYRVGIELAGTPEDRARALVAIVGTIDILDYTDVHAAQTHRAILGFDAKARFADLPDVHAFEPRHNQGQRWTGVMLCRRRVRAPTAVVHPRHPARFRLRLRAA